MADGAIENKALRDAVYKRPTADDAARRLSDYVQISHFVTKVLIRKRFSTIALPQQLTNLET